MFSEERRENRALLIEMDWTADTQRSGPGLDTSVRKIGLHAACREKISYFLLIGGLTTPF